jgi:putative nucleotidyltransferase with HDIG domain
MTIRDEFSMSADDADELLIARLHRHDAGTAAHSRATSRLAERIAVRAGLPAARVAVARRGALLHDVGKLTIPGELLRASRTLVGHELALMRSHAAAGRDFLDDVPDDVLSAVLDHHERIDGSGYPRKLRRDEIPLTTQIVSLADAIDAATTTRAYHVGISWKTLRAELENGGRLQFDRALLDVAIDVMERGTLASA